VDTKVYVCAMFVNRVVCLVDRLRLYYPFKSIFEWDTQNEWMNQSNKQKMK